MKKQILTATLIIAISAIGINTQAAGTQEIKYNQAGAVTNDNTPGFGSNAAFTPKNRARAGQIQRQIKLEKAIIHSVENRKNYNFNINTNNNNIQNQNNPKPELQPQLETENQIPNETEQKQPAKTTEKKKKSVEKRKGVTYYN